MLSLTNLSKLHRVPGTNVIVQKDLRVLHRIIAKLAASPNPTRVIHDQVNYGVHMEFGFHHSPGGGWVERRPWLVDNAMKSRDSFEKALASEHNLERIEGVVVKTAEDIVKVIQRDMKGAKTGRTYERDGGRLHQASAAEEAPAVDYGALIGSIRVSKPEEDRKSVV